MPLTLQLMFNNSSSIIFDMSDYRANIWKMYIFKFMISLHFIGAVLVPFFTDWGWNNIFADYDTSVLVHAVDVYIRDTDRGSS